MLRATHQNSASMKNGLRISEVNHTGSRGNDVVELAGGFNMRERLEQRLFELRREFRDGQTAISDLEKKLENIRSTVLRISGAIQVLEEELALPPDVGSVTESAQSSEEHKATRLPDPGVS